MQGNPGVSSGTYGFSSLFWNGEVILEALSRVQVRGTGIEQHHMEDANRSLNLSLQALNNRAINLFQVEQFVIPLVAGTPTYLISNEVVSIADAYYNTILSTGAGPDWDFPTNNWAEPIVSEDPQIVITESQDRWMRPMGRADYARIPNKTIPGPPLQYWFNRLGPPVQTTLTVWPVPMVGYPSAAITCFALRSAQDANLQNMETPDVPARFLDWLCADVAVRMARKYAPSMIGAAGSGGLRDDAIEAWGLAYTEDNEKAEVNIRPDLYRYWNV